MIVTLGTAKGVHILPKCDYRGKVFSKPVRAIKYAGLFEKAERKGWSHRCAKIGVRLTLDEGKLLTAATIAKRFGISYKEFPEVVETAKGMFNQRRLSLLDKFSAGFRMVQLLKEDGFFIPRRQKSDSARLVQYHLEKKHYAEFVQLVNEFDLNLRSLRDAELLEYDALSAIPPRPSGNTMEFPVYSALTPSPFDAQIKKILFERAYFGASENYFRETMLLSTLLSEPASASDLIKCAIFQLDFETASKIAKESKIHDQEISKHAEELLLHIFFNEWMADPLFLEMRKSPNGASFFQGLLSHLCNIPVSDREYAIAAKYGLSVIGLVKKARKDAFYECYYRANDY